MKILLAGDFKFFIYQEAFAQALERLGHQVDRFEYKKFIHDDFFGKVENYFAINGYNSWLLNKELKEACLQSNPNVLLIWRGARVSISTLSIIKKTLPKCLLVSYNNDDPFSPLYKTGGIYRKRLWKRFILSLPYYDINFVYREVNIEEYKRAKAKNVFLMRSYFIPTNRNYTKSIKDIDVCFIGHCEEHRMEYIKYLIENKIKVKVYGRGWNDKGFINLYQKRITELWGSDYEEVISRSKIAIAFLSKLNRDTYTRRNFEIPYLGSLMLSERTQDLQNLYQEEVDADFFSSKEELLKKVNFYLESKKLREKITLSGMKKAISNGYDIDSVARKMLNDINLVFNH